MRRGFVLVAVVAVPVTVRAQDPHDAPAGAPTPLEERVAGLEARLAQVEAERAGVAPTTSETHQAHSLGSVLTAVAEEVKVAGVAVGMFAWNLADPPGRKNRTLLRVKRSA